MSIIEPVDPVATFSQAKQAAEEARLVLVKEREQLRDAEKTRRADFRTKLQAIDKLLGRPRTETTRKPKPVEAKKASA